MRAVVLLAIVAAVLAGCGTSAPTPSPTCAPTATGRGVHAWPDLESQIPDSISGRPVTKISLIAHCQRQDAKTLAVLEQLDRSVYDLQIANAELEGTDLTVGAMRVVGAEGSRIIDSFEQVDSEDPDSTAVYTDVDLGGKRVTARTVEAKSSYLYGSGDVMFIVAGERALVESALELLP